ncbi:MAG: hypothetical protein HQK53_11915, partial [Oligoflexia bacterium]|nr:hypothetical protein [Oligoflexia bacterium]
PKITVYKTHKGALQVIDPYNSFDREEIVDIAKEMGLDNAIVQLGEKIETVDRLIDGLVKTRKYMAAVEIITKMDLAKPVDIKKIPERVLKMCVGEEIGLEEFKERVWQGLGLVRVYLKKDRTSEADKKEPLIIKNNYTLDQVLKRISNQMRDDVNKAYIWGKNARFPGQEVSFKFQVFDEMEVYFGR